MCVPSLLFVLFVISIDVPCYRYCSRLCIVLGRAIVIVIDRAIVIDSIRGIVGVIGLGLALVMVSTA